MPSARAPVRALHPPRTQGFRSWGFIRPSRFECGRRMPSAVLLASTLLLARTALAKEHARSTLAYSVAANGAACPSAADFEATVADRLEVRPVRGRRRAPDRRPGPAKRRVLARQHRRLRRPRHVGQARARLRHELRRPGHDGGRLRRPLARSRRRADASFSVAGQNRPRRRLPH